MIMPNRGLTIINEFRLYSLILSSKLPTAKKFKRRSKFNLGRQSKTIIVNEAGLCFGILSSKLSRCSPNLGLHWVCVLRFTKN